MRRFFDLSIRAKLVAAFGIMLCFTVGLGIFSMTRLAIVNANSNNLLGNVQGMQPLSDLARDPNAMAALAAMAEAAPSPIELQQITAAEQALRQRYLSQWKTYLPTIDPGRETADATGFNTAWGEITATAAQISHPGPSASSLAARPLLLHQLQSEIAVFDNNIDADLALQVAEAVKFAADTNAISSTASFGTLIVLAVAVIASALVVWLILKVVSVPITALTGVMRQLAVQEFELAIPCIDRLDELGAMARACEIFRVNGQALEKAHQALRSAEEQAQRLARHDALTGLPNRRVFSANLQANIARSMRDGSPYSVMLIDLDGFKKVNDLFGHHIGDMVLCEVAQRLQSNVRQQDTVARLGGDEFAIIIPDECGAPEHTERIKRVASQLIAAISRDVLCDGNIIDIGASIGIADCRAGITDVSNMLHAADMAMYRAKQSGHGAFRFFEQGMDVELRAQEMLERDLMRAIDAEDILPHYQPLIDIDTNRIRGFEALARWDHPTRGAIAPDVFIPMAERLSLMPKLTASILRQACRDARHWPDQTRVAVNFPPSAFQNAELTNWILKILSSEGLPPRRLEIEITEDALLGDVERIRSTLTSLKGFGITISLDDFGTGYSSLNHLREFKFDKVKIDRSFVKAMEAENGDNEKIIDAILGLTKSLGLPTVAEGIESAVVLQQLRSKGCEFGQGYFFAKAVPAEAALEMLKQAEAGSLAAERIMCSS